MADDDEGSERAERDPELRFEVVHVSRSHRRAEAVFWRLTASGLTARMGLVEQRNGKGRLVRTHQVLVPRRQVVRATKLAAATLAEEDTAPRVGLRDRIEGRAYEGLMTVVWMAIALAIIAAFLIHAS